MEHFFRQLIASFKYTAISDRMEASEPISEGFIFIRELIFTSEYSPSI